MPTLASDEEPDGEPLDDQTWACFAGLLLIPGLVIVSIGAGVSWFVFDADWGIVGLFLSLAIAITVTFIVPLVLGILFSGALSTIGLASLEPWVSWAVVLASSLVIAIGWTVLMFGLETDPLAMALALPGLLVSVVGTATALVLLGAGLVVTLVLLVGHWSRQDRARRRAP